MSVFSHNTPGTRHKGCSYVNVASLLVFMHISPQFIIWRHAVLSASVRYWILSHQSKNISQRYFTQISRFLSAGLEGVILSSSCAQLWHWRGHHLQCAVEAAEWRAGEHPSQGERSLQKSSEDDSFGQSHFIHLSHTVHTFTYPFYFCYPQERKKAHAHTVTPLTLFVTCLYTTLTSSSCWM